MSAKLKKTLAAAPLWVWMVCFTIIPMLLVVYYAFSDGAGGYTAENIISAATNSNYLKSILISFRHALMSTAVCLVIGYPVAYFLSRMKTGGGFVILLFMLPMWMNFLIRTYALKSIIDKGSLLDNLMVSLGFDSGLLINSDFAVALGMVYNFLPFLILPIYTSMLKIDERVIEASRDLGAGSLTVFRRIYLPLTMPGIVSGITMVFVPAVTTFIIPQMLNNKYMTIGSLIEYKFKQEVSMEGISGVGSALSLLLMIAVIIIMTVVNAVDKDGDTAM